MKMKIMLNETEAVRLACTASAVINGVDADYYAGPVGGVMKATYTIRTFFYLLTPTETYRDSLATVPDFFSAAFPYFVLLMAVEIAVGLAMGRKNYAINDTATSLFATALSRTSNLFEKTVDMAIYLYIYEHWRLVDMPSHSITTYIVCMLALDFGYYWFHRAAHEVNFLWAFHQTHHSSEYYNLSTSLRLSVLVKWATYIFYLPLAFFIPPPVYACHMQLNLLYQFWIHTEFIGNLGFPLEFFFNTASHHRVHHGRNPYCIDKNYAGFLIIWDRIFGTFEAERPNEKIHYGLIHNIKTFDPISVQFVTFKDIWRKLRANLASSKYHGMDKAKNALKAVFYGPGWFSRKPYHRLGDPADLPPIEPNPQRYNPPIAGWKRAYCLFHFFFSSLIFFYIVNSGRTIRSMPLALVTLLQILASTWTIGRIFDRRPYAKWTEIVRCLILIVLTDFQLASFTGAANLIKPFQLIFVISIIIQLTMTDQGKEKENENEKEKESKQISSSRQLFECKKQR